MRSAIAWRARSTMTSVHVATSAASSSTKAGSLPNDSASAPDTMATSSSEVRRPEAQHGRTGSLAGGGSPPRRGAAPADQPQANHTHVLPKEQSHAKTHTRGADTDLKVTTHSR